jgi:hypothetical protein
VEDISGFYRPAFNSGLKYNQISLDCKPLRYPHHKDRKSKMISIAVFESES